MGAAAAAAAAGLSGAARLERQEEALWEEREELLDAQVWASALAVQTAQAQGWVA
jgi:hypothetical protein